ncbi:hypothetical protein PILCRDRAFT_825991 [Piloderma croceum F 1598]|uniref:Hydrophobin n=1 Tax=Piloderma croceum (strain F 1598) TaxID=765440 RepID=A0A0C3BHD5_PILCF|nr:hypothetical protein PILCRDRAFT_825991 [Piloderma croceum F 1598]
MKFLKSASFFALSLAMYSSASVIRRDDQCIGEGFPCQTLIPDLLVCCDGLGCAGLLGLVGPVGLCEYGVGE